MMRALLGVAFWLYFCAGVGVAAAGYAKGITDWFTLTVGILMWPAVLVALLVG